MGMSNPKHTPLPWVIIQADTERLEIDQTLVRATGAILIGKYGYKLTIEGRTSEEEFMANLHLIAAAPKLLRALRELMNQVLEGGLYISQTHYNV
jgi:hypothetical protein